jgi:hypothetical protein
MRIQRKAKRTGTSATSMILRPESDATRVRRKVRASVLRVSRATQHSAGRVERRADRIPVRSKVTERRLLRRRAATT